MKLNYDEEQEQMRKQVKVIKAYNQYQTKQIAEMLNISYRYFNNWLNGMCDVGTAKKEAIKAFIADNRKEVF